MDQESDYKKFLPIVAEVNEGTVYRWCGCGDSQTQPFCDKENCEMAVTYKATLTEDAVFCNCKQTKNPPWCDGSHAKFLLEVVKNRQTK